MREAAAQRLRPAQNIRLLPFCPAGTRGAAIPCEEGRVTSPRRKRFLRPVLLLLAFVALWLLVGRSEWARALTAESLRALITAAGPWGLVVFVALFAGGQLAQLPGVIFLVAARLAFGPALGFAAAYVGAVLGVALTFAVVRAVGGPPLDAVSFAPAKRWLGRLEAKPVQTVALLRAVLLLSPALNYALALTPVRPRAHLAGSALGLVVPVAAWVFLSEAVLALVHRVA